MSTAPTDLKKCPRCGGDSRELVRIDAGMRLSLTESGHRKEGALEVCTNCISDLSKMVSQGAKLRAQRKAREANLMALFRNRINVLKQARAYLAQKVFAEAAIEFEKYLRTLEVVYDTKPGALTPDTFKSAKKSSEMDVILSVLWDLIKIYDMNINYQGKLKEKIELFILFSKSTPAFAKLARKMHAYAPKARNKAIISELLKRCNAPRPRCFIASAAYESPEHPSVLTLCAFRDQVLLATPLGEAFVSMYYYFSPTIAGILDRCYFLKPCVRAALYPLVKIANQKFHLNN
ncbi:MAG: CFI-box-CTERM domain-containing protein [Pseudomonadota bacterium]|nr:CFI-box-CTERM domain-containing protein [Pseudomonadota bacterium]